MELDGSSWTLSALSLDFGGGGGGGGRMQAPELPGGEEVEETIAPEGMRNSLMSFL